MTDYFGIVLTGFSTGMGVIFAQEFWQWFKKMRLHRFPVDLAEDMIENVRDLGVKRKRKR